MCRCRYVSVYVRVKVYLCLEYVCISNNAFIDTEKYSHALALSHKNIYRYTYVLHMNMCTCVTENACENNTKIIS